MRDHRMGLNLMTDVLDVLDRHGYASGDDEHAGRAIFLVSDLAHIYEGSQDHPFGPAVNEIPPRTEPGQPAPASQHAVLVPAGEVTTLLAALDIAADDQRDRAGLCSDCTSQSCPACESRLRDAQAYDHLSVQLDQAAEASGAAAARHSGRGPVADREAGQ
jgi:hypothetical protein